MHVPQQQRAGARRHGVRQPEDQHGDPADDVHEQRPRALLGVRRPDLRVVQPDARHSPHRRIADEARGGHLVVPGGGARGRSPARAQPDARLPGGVLGAAHERVVAVGVRRHRDAAAAVPRVRRQPVQSRRVERHDRRRARLSRHGHRLPEMSVRRDVRPRHPQQRRVLGREHGGAGGAVDGRLPARVLRAAQPVVGGVRLVRAAPRRRAVRPVRGGPVGGDVRPRVRTERRLRLAQLPGAAVDGAVRRPLRALLHVRARHLAARQRRRAEAQRAAAWRGREARPRRPVRERLPADRHVLPADVGPAARRRRVREELAPRETQSPGGCPAECPAQRDAQTGDVRRVVVPRARLSFPRHHAVSEDCLQVDIRPRAVRRSPRHIRCHRTRLLLDESGEASENWAADDARAVTADRRVAVAVYVPDSGRVCPNDR